MLLTSPEGERYLDSIRQAVRAVIEYGSPEAAAVALGVTVEDVEERRSSVYGCAFIEWTYGPARTYLRHSYTHALHAAGFSVAGIARVFGDAKAEEVERWLATPPPEESTEPVRTRYTGSTCRRCGNPERYSGSNRCVVCAYAIVKRGRGEAGMGLRV
jgi:hypothetical protein